MFCQQCGQRLQPGQTTCAACGWAVPVQGTPGGSPGDSVQRLVAETRAAAKDLVRATAQLSQKVVTKAQEAAKSPSASAKKAARRVSKELDAAAKKIDEILKDL